MAGLLMLGAIVVVFLLYLADRAMKARVRARRLDRMSRRLAGAAARSEKQQAARQAADAASAELTTYLPAINRSPLTLPGQAADAQAYGADGAAADRPAGPGELHGVRDEVAE